jgi:alkylated DNA repair dioxygenase AlkB
MANYYPKLIDTDTAESLFLYLQHNTPWQDGIRDRSKKITRQAYSVDIGSGNPVDLLIIDIVIGVVAKIATANYRVGGIYVNHYRDGNDRTPTHSHPETIQLIISLGATRTLKIKSHTYPLSSGDVIVFGGSPHGVPAEPHVTTARISIATFLIPA